jgi:glucose-6-phosphate 1-dehydrogenase
MTTSCTYVIFGATGNLSSIKLLPALYHLDRAGQLDAGVRVLCWAAASSPKQWRRETVRAGWRQGPRRAR